MAALLTCAGLNKRFGGLLAIGGVDLAIRAGEIVGLIGPNGAGKTTLVNLLTGEIAPTSGTIAFEGRDITGLAPYERARLGLARTFQIPRPFGTMTLRDNVRTAALFGAAGRDRSPAAVDAAVRDVLAATGLTGTADQFPSMLSTASLKRLEMARGLAAGAKVLFLDEPLGGLNQTETRDAVRLIRTLPDQGITVVLIEHVIKAVTAVSDRVLVLAGGRKLAEGTPAEIVADEEVKKAYLGDIDAAVARSRGRRLPPALSASAPA